MSATNARGMEKGLRKMHDRIDKHMCAEAGLLRVMWEKTAEGFVAAYIEYEALAAKCFERKLMPSSTDLRTMAAMISKQVVPAVISNADVARDAAYAATVATSISRT